MVAVRYSQGVSSLVDPSTGGPLVRHTHALDTPAITDGWGEALEPVAPPPRLETAPLHVGGLLDGRVVRGTGAPAEGAKVELIRIWRKETRAGTADILEVAGRVTTGADGRFAFELVESPHWDRQVADGYLLRATVPEGADPELEPADVEQIGSRIRLQNRLAHVNIALLGRGVVHGELVYEDTGEPIADGSVSATSTLFNEQSTVATEEDGSFRIGGVPVGPITLTGRDRDGRRGYATIGVEEPGASVQVRLAIPRAPPELGTITGRVVRLSTGDPVGGAQVQVYSNGHGVGAATTDALGRFRFDDVPAGLITLQAAAWQISRTSVVSSVSLAAGESRDVTLRLADGATRTVTGTVVFHDPITNSDLPVAGAVAFITGPGVFAYTDAAGRYRIEGVPVQGLQEPPYQVTVIDYARGLQGAVALPPILDVTEDVVEAQRVVLESMKGGIDGVVLDPLGRPLGGVEVVLRDEARATTSLPDGSFSFDDVGVGGHLVLAHVGDGLQAGKVGYFASTKVDVVYGGHRPFKTLRMVGSGVVTVHTTTATATGILTPIYYKPTWFHDGSWTIKVKGSYIETTTDPNGDLELVLPVGHYEIVAYNPFHGVKTISAEIDYAGQVKHHEVLFEDAATVTGQVVDVDGHTPVPDITVTLSAHGLLPQTQSTDGQGRFRFELVPQGQVVVTAEGLVGTVERIGRTIGSVRLGGQELDVTVQMKAQGTVRGRVMEQYNGALQPLAFAQYSLREGSFPYRRLPEDGSWYLTDAEGRYQVSHVYAGGVTVVARDSTQIRRTGSARGTITADWEVLDLPDVVLSTSVGSLEVLVRDPETGGSVPDAQVRLSNGEWTVSGPDGKVYFDALALGTYSVYAFHAPTGRSGRLGGLAVLTPGQHVAGTVYLDQRGEVRGTLYDDATRTVGVAGGTVQLTGKTAGGRVTALASTSGTAGEEGRFSFLGIPEGTFDLEAAVQTSARRARAEATLTETSPVADVVMVLEPVADVYVRLFERLSTGELPVDLSTGLFSTRITQSGYDFTSSVPDPATGLFYFPDLLVSRSADLSAQEISGERRSVAVHFRDLTSPPPIDGDGSPGDPYRLVLGPKGAVRVSVADGAGLPVAGADVTLVASGQRFPSVTGADGTVSFAAVPAGPLTASATSPTTGTGGTARGTLTYDDEVVELAVQLAPAVAAHGVVYLPVADDRYSGDPSTLVPAAGIIVQIRDSKGETQTILTDADGAYRFDVLPTGGYRLDAQDTNGDQRAGAQGTLVGPDGFDNPLPPLLLDAAPPRIVSIVPPPGLEGVSRTATVEVVFSEPLLSTVLPTGQSSSPYFHLTAADGSAATGSWTSTIDAQGYQAVRFTPSSPYENFTTYTLTIRGGTGGIRDRIGRPLTESGDVGSNFKTSDGVGPEVIATTPSLDRPVDPARPIRFDFNEAVEGPDEAFDGDGVGDAVVLEGQRADGTWVALPVTLFLTRSGYSVQVEAVDGVTLQDDTLRRRVTVRGLSDVYGNPMPEYQRSFRLYDAHPPVVDAVPFPGNAPDGELVQGVDYLLVPVLSAIDDVTAEEPGGDLDRVDYYFEDPTDPSHPVDPSFSATAYPFAFPFVGAYSGDGVTPRPFPVWVRAVDTSTNRSNVVAVEMEVLPNAGPSVGAASFEALSPVAGTLYAGSSLRATVSGLDDVDGSQLTLSLELQGGRRRRAARRQPRPAGLPAGVGTLGRPAAGDLRRRAANRPGRRHAGLRARPGDRLPGRGGDARKRAPAGGGRRDAGGGGRLRGEAGRRRPGERLLPRRIVLLRAPGHRRRDGGRLGRGRGRPQRPLPGAADGDTGRRHAGALPDVEPDGAGRPGDRGDGGRRDGAGARPGRQRDRGDPAVLRRSGARSDRAGRSLDRPLDRRALAGRLHLGRLGRGRDPAAAGRRQRHDRGRHRHSAAGQHRQRPVPWAGPEPGHRRARAGRRRGRRSGGGRHGRTGPRPLRGPLAGAERCPRGDGAAVRGAHRRRRRHRDGRPGADDGGAGAAGVRGRGDRGRADRSDDGGGRRSGRRRVPARRRHAQPPPPGRRRRAQPAGAPPLYRRHPRRRSPDGVAERPDRAGDHHVRLGGAVLPSGAGDRAGAERRSGEPDRRLRAGPPGRHADPRARSARRDRQRASGRRLPRWTGGLRLAVRRLGAERSHRARHGVRQSARSPPARWRRDQRQRVDRRRRRRRRGARLRRHGRGPVGWRPAGRRR